MLDLAAVLWSGAALFAVAFVFWLISMTIDDVSIVDSLWALMFLVSAAFYAVLADQIGPRTSLVLILTAIWAVRLCTYMTWRNHGQPEDYRYQAIRQNNEPGFRWKSLFIVFWLQALLAWVISAPLLAAIGGTAPIALLDYLGVGLVVIGVFFEAVGDWQLTAFKRNPANRSKVMDRGLWRYTRHPNYFGNFTLWWGFYLVALSAGGWSTVFAPLLMTVLLLRVSGVALLEKDIAERRPAYAGYVRRTNAFFPGPPRRLSEEDTA